MKFTFSYLLFLFFTLNYFPSFSQTQFCIAIGGSGSEIAYEILQLSDGGYCIAGWTTSFGQGGRDVYIVKLNTIGIIEWARTVGGSSDDDLTSALQTMDGGFIASGGTTSYGQGDKDVYVVKLAFDGTVLWTKSFGDFGYEVSGTIIENYNGVYTLGGWTTSLGSGASEGYLLRIDNSGNLLWTRSLGGSGADLLYSVIQTPDYGFIVAGATGSFGAGSNDVYFAKFDTIGSLLWTKTVGGSAAEWSFSIVTTTDSGYVIGATTASYGAGGDDFYVLKIDSQGSLQWTRTIGGPGTEWSRSIIQTSDGGFAVTGFTSSFGAGGQDVYLVKLTGSGNFEWSRTFGGVGDDVGMSLIETSDGGLAITGSTASFGSGGMDVYIIKIAPGNVNCCITGNDMGTTASGGVTGSGGQISSGGFVSSGGVTGSGGILKNQCCILSVSSNITKTDVSCYTYSDGSAQSNPSGGTPPYTFNWSNGQTGSAATGLSTGVYFFTITDASSCLDIDTVIITAPPPITAITGTRSSICDNNTGSAWITPAGGQPPYITYWSTGSFSDTISGLIAGFYTVTVTDFSGCTTVNTIIVSDSGAAALLVSSQNDITCYGYSNGSAIVTAAGGYPPLSFFWSNGQSDAGITQTTIDSLAAGNYSVTVTDTAGCENFLGLTLTEPDSLIVAATATDATCITSGTASATTTGGVPPYSYIWSTGGASATLSALGPGNYTVTITDNNGCTDSAAVTVNMLGSVIAAITGSGPICAGEQMQLTASGGDNYLWNTGDTATLINISPDTTTLYTVITGTGTCFDTTGYEVIVFPAVTVSAGNDTAIMIGGSASISAAISGGTAPFFITWTPDGQTVQDINVSPAATTRYHITVSDANGCAVTDSVDVFVVLCDAEVFVPNAFAPDCRCADKYFKVYSECIIQLNLYVFDRWGEKVFEYNGSPLPSGGAGGGAWWDGTYKNKPMDAGVFVWYIKYTTINKPEEESALEGNVHLIR